MPFLKSQLVLTPEERSQKRKVVLRDTIALLTLLVVTAALFTGTVFLFRSFTNLRSRLAKRWLARGEAALHNGHPELAVEDLRSALAYSPGQRTIEVELAEALAGAGRTQEATSYFNTLWEAEPGSGIINLQLARLAARQNNQDEALEHYRASIYGTWEGDGTTRRREVRLELIDYLIGMRRDEQARSELLIAVGNAPDDIPTRLEIAALMEKAGDPASASQIYKKILQHGAPNLAALEGAGRTAFALGNYAQARDYLEKALNHPAIATQSAQARQDLRDLLEEAVQILLLYPSPSLSTRAQAERVLRDRNLVFDRLGACGVSLPGKPGGQITGPLIGPVMDKWTQLPNWANLTVARLQKDEALRQQVLDLVYETVNAADRDCPTPTAENALLSRIAKNPGAVEAQ
ncbi:tetratricopeptide repeat protein [Acidisarcina polymorpha]|nr:tetratricopeptide repeat protein [Acidisarcina polymorpha]